MSTLTESPSALSGPSPKPLLASILWRVSMACLALMPLGMTIAHRSSPLFLGLSTVFALLAILAEGQLRETVQDALLSLRSPLGLAALAFIGWAALSLGWSEVRETSLDALGEFVLPLAFAFVLWLILPRRMTAQAFWLLVIAICLSQLLMLMDLRSNLILRKALGMRFDAYIFNRTSLTLLMLLPPLIAWLSGYVRAGKALASAVFIIVSLAIFNSDSGAAVMGLLLATATFLVAFIFPKLGGLAVRVAFIATLALAPVLGPLADHVLTNGIHKVFAQNHSRARVDIWRSFDAAIAQQPLLGAGFGASPRMNETSVAQKIPADQSILLAVGHPHNASIQIWAELGFVGALLAGIVGWLTLREIECLPRTQRALGLGLIGAILAVSMVGHGAWQGWWIAAIGASVIWLRATGQSPQEKV